MAEHEAKEAYGHGELHYDGSHSPPGNGKYVAVFVALCILTFTSFIIGNSKAIMATPTIGWTGMMAVSCAKAFLVILFFMHLKWEANWKYVLTIPASMMSIFLLLMLVPDIGMRTVKYTHERWLHAAQPQEEHAENSAHQHAEDASTSGHGGH